MPNMDLGLALLAIIGSYALGCFNAGYYTVRWRTGQDVRTHGSGNAGATNVGRLLGWSWSCIVFILDCAKGALAVAVAHRLHFDSWIVALVVIAVVAGHIWPAQLNFRGGKGIATAAGALLVYAPLVIAVMLALFAVVFPFVRRFTIAGLIAFALAPLASLMFRPSLSTLTCLSVVAVIVSFAHRKNWREQWMRWRPAPADPETQTSNEPAK
jgi:acyl phosphate:glycerol-3-phosphate acyltransferase